LSEKEEDSLERADKYQDADVDPRLFFSAERRGADLHQRPYIGMRAHGHWLRPYCGE
jgi:hypothetical protein